MIVTENTEVFLLLRSPLKVHVLSNVFAGDYLRYIRWCGQQFCTGMKLLLVKRRQA